VQEKEIKGIQIGNEEIKLFLLANDMIQKILKSDKQFQQVSGYIINT
jgi:hypothetical protein